MRLTALLLCTCVVSCGARPTVPSGPAEAPAAPTDAPPSAGADEIAGAEAGADAPESVDQAPPADALDAALRRLGATAPDALPDAVQSTSVATLRPALAALGPDAPAYGWAALRVGRVLAHLRRFREAESVLSAAAEKAPTHAAAKAIGAALQRLQARGKAHPGRVGVLLPTSGLYGAIGQSALTAIQLAGALHPEVKLVVYDTGGEASRAATGVEHLVLEEHVSAIIGPIGQIESYAAAVAAERFEVPIMTLTAREDVTRLGAFVFRHRLTWSAQARAIARYAVSEMGLRRFAILYPNDDYGREMMRAFWATVESLGGEVRGAQSYPLHATRFDTPIKKLIGRYYLGARAKDAHWEQLNRKARDKSMHVPPVVDFEALFIPDNGSRAGMLLTFLAFWDVPIRTEQNQNARELAARFGGEVPQLVQVLGGNGLNSQRFLQRAGPLSTNAVFVDAFLPDAPSAQAFNQDYQAKAGRPPAPLAAHAFDATRIVLAAATGQTDRAAVRRALLLVRNFPGVVGETSIGGDGDAEIALYVLTVRPEEGIVPRTEEMGADEPRRDEDAPRN